MSVFFPNESSIIVVLEIAVVAKAEAPPLLIGISKSSRSIKIGRTKQTKKKKQKSATARATARPHHVCK